MASNRSPASAFLLLALGLLTSACGGPPLSDKEDIARALTGASIPSTHAKGALMSVYASGISTPAITLRGSQSGEVKLTINPVGVVVGAIGKGVMLDLEYMDYSMDGIFRLHGSVSMLANFEYVAEQGEDPYADVKLTAVGRIKLSGVYSDELRANISLITRFQALQTQEPSIALRLNGSVHGLAESFEFDNEDVAVLWQQAAR
jgi:hypothetical protein